MNLSCLLWLGRNNFSEITMSKLNCGRWPDHVIGGTFEIPVVAKNPATGAAHNISGYQYRVIVQSELDGSEADYEIDFTHTVGDKVKDSGVDGYAFPTIESDAQAGLTEGDKYATVIRIIPGTNPLNQKVMGPFRWRVSLGY